MPTSPLDNPLAALADPARLAELDKLLDNAVPADLPEQQRLPMLLEMADLRAAIGQGQAAEESLRQQALPIAERLCDRHSQGLIHGKIADLLAARGDLDAALAEQQLRLPLAGSSEDENTLAHVKFSIAQLRLQRGDHRQGAAQAIFEELADAYSIVKKLGQADGVGSIGLLLAQMLALGGEREAALRVTTEAEAAFRHLDDSANVAQVLSLREAIIGAEN